MTLRLTTGWMRRALTMLAFFALPAQAELVVYTAQLIRTMGT